MIAPSSYGLLIPLFHAIHKYSLIEPSRNAYGNGFAELQSRAIR